MVDGVEEAAPAVDALGEITIDEKIGHGAGGRGQQRGGHGEPAQDEGCV